MQMRTGCECRRRTRDFIRTSERKRVEIIVGRCAGQGQSRFALSLGNEMRLGRQRDRWDGFTA